MQKITRKTRALLVAGTMIAAGFFSGFVIFTIGSAIDWFEADEGPDD